MIPKLETELKKFEIVENLIKSIYLIKFDMMSVLLISLLLILFFIYEKFTNKVTVSDIKFQIRQERLNLLKKEPRTIVVYESPHRLLKTLIDFVKIFGNDRQIVLGRELTKYYEEFWRGSLKEAVLHYQQNKNIKGEFTLVLSGCSQDNLLDLNIEQVKIELQKLLERGMTRSQASKYLATTVKFSRREIYELSLNNL